MSDRPKYATRKFRLVGDQQVALAGTVLMNAPIDPLHPLEVVIREEVKVRKPDQNSLMWSGPLADIAEQAYVGGRSYSTEVWHEFFKREFLPEQYDEEYCKEGYRKWEFDPKGERVLVGSTTQLTVKGFAQYLTQVMAYGANLGVVYSERRTSEYGQRSAA